MIIGIGKKGYKWLLDPQGTILKMKRKLDIHSTTIGYDNNEVPIKLYLDNGYINNRLEISIDARTWKVYFYGVVIGRVDNDGGIELNEESSER